MKRILFIMFILTSILLIKGVYADSFCCKDPDSNQPKCYGSGICCKKDDPVNQYWDPAFCFQKFEYHGDTDYFNAFWTIVTNKNLIIECDLGNQQCLPYDFVQTSGSGSCSVANPNYDYTQDNIISCKVFDRPSTFLERKYPSSFRPVKFEILPIPSLTTTVGKEVEMKINVRNTGFLDDNYTVDIVPSQSSVLVNNPEVIITKLSNNEIGTAISGLRTLAVSSSPILVRIYVRSSIDQSFNDQSSCNPDCSYLGSNSICYNGKCAEYIDVNVKGQMSSLPDFDFSGIIQIVLLASLVLVLVSFKKVKTHSKQ